LNASCAGEERYPALLAVMSTVTIEPAVFQGNTFDAVEYGESEDVTATFTECVWDFANITVVGSLYVITAGCESVEEFTSIASCITRTVPPSRTGTKSPSVTASPVGTVTNSPSPTATISPIPTPLASVTRSPGQTGTQSPAASESDLPEGYSMIGTLTMSVTLTVSMSQAIESFIVYTFSPTISLTEVLVDVDATLSVTLTEAASHVMFSSIEFAVQYIPVPVYESIPTSVYFAIQVANAPTPDQKLSNAVIIGVASGGGALIALIAAAVIFMCRSKAKMDEFDKSEGDVPPSTPRTGGSATGTAGTSTAGQRHEDGNNWDSGVAL
jgi:hypothetical protein